MADGPTFSAPYFASLAPRLGQIPDLFGNVPRGGTSTPMDVAAHQSIEAMNYVDKMKKGLEMGQMLARMPREAAENAYQKSAADFAKQHLKAMQDRLAQIGKGTNPDTGQPFIEYTDKNGNPVTIGAQQDYWRNRTLLESNLTVGPQGGTYDPLRTLIQTYQWHPEWTSNPPVGGVGVPGTGPPPASSNAPQKTGSQQKSIEQPKVDQTPKIIRPGIDDTTQVNFNNPSANVAALGSPLMPSGFTSVAPASFNPVAPGQYLAQNQNQGLTPYSPFG